MAYENQDRVISALKRDGGGAKFDYLQDPYNPSVSLTRATIKKGNETQVVIFRMAN